MANSRLRVVLTSEYTGGFSDTCQNVFYYEGDGGTVDAADFIGAFDDHILTRLATLTVNTVYFTDVSVVDLDDPSNFAAGPPPLTTQGVIAAVSPLPSFMALSYQYLRASYASRHGWKRFAGLDEGMILNGALVSPYDANAGFMADRLATRVNMLPLGAYPRIARRPGPGQPLSATVFFPIQDVVYRRVTTQNTRKTW